MKGGGGVPPKKKFKPLLQPVKQQSINTQGQSIIYLIKKHLIIILQILIISDRLPDVPDAG